MTWIVDWDAKTGMRRQFEIRRQQDGALVLRGAMEFLYVEMSSGRIRRMPPKFISGYGVAVLSAAAADR